MGYFLTMAGDYYEGDRAHPTDRDVPQRPDSRYTPVISDDGVFLNWAAPTQDAPPSTDDAMRAGLLKVWLLADPVSAAKDPDYKVLADAQAADVAAAAAVADDVTGGNRDGITTT